MSETPPRRLLADGMLGRLARWLRMLGYDTAYDNQADDHELAHRSRLESRTLLTRDHELAGRRGLDCVFIESEVLKEQVHQVVEQVGAPPEPPLHRCSVCNTPLEAATAARVRDCVPTYVLQTQDTFRLCPGCGRVYWAGTHRDGIMEQLESLRGQG